MSKRNLFPALLLITEDATIRHWMKKHLEGLYVIFDVQSVHKVREVVANSILDCIIVDANFPDFPALKLITEIKSALHQSLTPILLITGKLKKSYREEALDAGVTDFLSHNLDIEELELRIATTKRLKQTQEKTIEQLGKISKKGAYPKQTLLKNIVLLQDEALHLFNEAKKTKEPLSLLTLRIDQFAKIEEEEGFIAANELSYRISEWIEEKMPDKSLLIPSSEGRFILLIPNTPLIEAKQWSETLKEKMQHQLFPIKERKLHMTLSIILTSPKASQDLDQMIHSAFKTLKEAQNRTEQTIFIDQDNL